MLAALLLSLLTCASAPQSDVVIFVIDDVADSDLDVVPTPNLDALAAGGMRFRRAYAHAWCAPTRDSLNRSAWLGIDRGDACAPPGPNTPPPSATFGMAAAFKSAGYATLHVGKWHIGTAPTGDWRLAPAFFGYDSVRNGIFVGPVCNIPGAAQMRVDDGVESIVTEDNTIACRDAFLEWWNATPSPRFAVVNFGSAHAPFKRPPSSILPPGTPNPFNPTNRQEFEWEIQGVDFVLGQMLAVVGPQAYVVFLGDNGTPGLVAGENPSKTVATRPDQDPAKVKLTCYEDGVRVPLIFRGPGVVSGENRCPVHAIDILPTFAQIFGASAMPQAQGRPFGASLIGLKGSTAPVFVWAPSPRLDRAMIGPRWKLLTRPDGVEELFDLSNDPRELSPLPPTGPEADALRAARDAILLGG